MPSLTLTVAVPLRYVRADTLLPRHHTLGYAVINDSAVGAREIATIIDDEYLELKVWHNLTLGFFTGQGYGAPHVSRLRYDLPFRSGPDTLAGFLDKWCKAQGVDNEHRPATPQLVNLINHLRLPLRYGRAVLRELLTRLLIRIFKPDPALVGRSTVKRAGVTTILNNLFDHLTEQGAFQKALPKSRAAAAPVIQDVVDANTPPPTPVAARNTRRPTPVVPITSAPATSRTAQFFSQPSPPASASPPTPSPPALRAGPFMRQPTAVVTSAPSALSASRTAHRPTPAFAAPPASRAAELLSQPSPSTISSRGSPAPGLPVLDSPSSFTVLHSPTIAPSSTASPPPVNNCYGAREEYMRRILENSLDRFDDVEHDIKVHTRRADQQDEYIMKLAQGVVHVSQKVKAREVL